MCLSLLDSLQSGGPLCASSSTCPLSGLSLILADTTQCCLPPSFRNPRLGTLDLRGARHQCRRFTQTSWGGALLIDLPITLMRVAICLDRPSTTTPTRPKEQTLLSTSRKKQRSRSQDRRYTSCIHETSNSELSLSSSVNAGVSYGMGRKDMRWGDPQGPVSEGPTIQSRNNRSTGYTMRCS